MSQVSQTTGRVARRVRHETKMRLLQVRDVQRITPKMVRIVVGGEDLTGFISAAHDDHVKVFFPHPGQEKPVLPTPSPNGPVYPEGVERPPSRDYTPRRYDGGANTLTLDFVLHDAGRQRRGQHKRGRGIFSVSAARAARSSYLMISTGICLPETRPRYRRSDAAWKNCLPAPAPLSL